jgi:superfamily II DNA or RNA helicase
MANSYYSYMDRFLRILMVLIYMTSGAPARGTEVPTILHANSPANPRSLFLDKRTNLFLIRLRYSKTFSQTGREQGALRLLPYAVSQLVLIYLVIIVPFREFLEGYMHKTTTRGSYLLFYSKTRLLTSSNLSTTLIGLSNRLLGQSINISSFRHMMQAFIRYMMPPEAKTLLDLEGEGLDHEALAALQMHHSKETALKVYGRQGQHLSGFSANQQVALVDFSLKFHEFFGLNPDQFMAFAEIYFPSLSTPSSSSRGLGLPSNSAALRPRAKHIHALSQTESGLPPPKKVKIHELVLYIGSQSARPEMFIPPDLIARHEIQAGDSTDESATPPAMDSRDELVQSSLIYNRDIDFSKEDPLLSIFRLFINNTNAEFKSIGQRKALFYMLKRVPELVVVLPTAGGKSTLFLLAASLSESNVNLIIVPLVALKMDLYRKAIASEVPVAIWEHLHGDTPPMSMVLISIESTNHTQFLGWCQNLIGEGKLDRVVLDECHLIYSARSYRPIMNKISQIRKLKVPLLLTTATLSKSAMQEITKILVLNTPLLVQESINQPNIHYSVRKFDKFENRQQHHFSEILGFLLEFTPRWNLPYPKFANFRPGQSGRTPYRGVKAIVFFQFINTLKDFYNLRPDLFAHAHASMPEAEFRHELDLFIRGDRPILLATSAVGTGFDFSGVNLVVFYPRAWILEDFIQGSGRLSRAPNQIGHCVVFTTEFAMQEQKSEGDGAQHMRLWLNNTPCRRQIIRLIFDSANQGACFPWEKQCDLCTTREGVFEFANKSVLMKNQGHAIVLDQLRETLDWIRNHCLYCLFGQFSLAMEKMNEESVELMHGQAFGHQMGIVQVIQWGQSLGILAKQGHGTILSEENQETRNAFRTWRTDFRPTRDVCCFLCYLPTKFCSITRRKDGKCAYEGFLQGFGALTTMNPNFLNVFGGAYKPNVEIRGQHTNILAIKQWLLQIDRDLFGTEALYLVVTLYWWGWHMKEALEGQKIGP